MELEAILSEITQEMKYASQFYSYVNHKITKVNKLAKYNKNHLDSAQI